jgi:hypothetical protein
LNVGNGFVLWALAPRYALWFHQLRVIYDDRGHETTLPHQPSTFEPWNLVLAVLTFTAEIVFLVWQYDAARVARNLGYPARRSPAGGVGAWFVPVINLWMPYQAVRDCLPPRHVARPLVARAWLLRIVTASLNATLFVILPLTRTVGIGLFGIHTVLEVLLIATAYRVVKAIDQQHRRARPVNA